MEFYLWFGGLLKVIFVDEIVCFRSGMVALHPVDPEVVGIRSGILELTIRFLDFMQLFPQFDIHQAWRFVACGQVT